MDLRLLVGGEWVSVGVGGQVWGLWDATIRWEGGMKKFSAFGPWTGVELAVCWVSVRRACLGGPGGAMRGLVALEVGGWRDRTRDQVGLLSWGR